MKAEHQATRGPPRKAVVAVTARRKEWQGGNSPFDHDADRFSQEHQYLLGFRISHPLKPIVEDQVDSSPINLALTTLASVHQTGIKRLVTEEVCA
ncbi:hypothetical protein [Skermanella stibiiresistens]|uniref:hypothetical protein n=1 Tax=Skermanella stibiiresistens TaxID=913326 RepID=UPI0012F94B64|nr:hypothetical protein [Skermanella stibiiresistens]